MLTIIPAPAKAHASGHSAKNTYPKISATMRPTYLNCAVKLTSPILIARTLTIYPKKIAADDPINEAQATKVMGIQGSYTVAQVAAMNTPSPAKNDISWDDSFDPKLRAVKSRIVTHTTAVNPNSE